MLCGPICRFTKLVVLTTEYLFTVSYRLHPKALAHMSARETASAISLKVRNSFFHYHLYLLYAGRKSYCLKFVVPTHSPRLEFESNLSSYCDKAAVIGTDVPIASSSPKRPSLLK
jgi:hypothetical protein